MKNLRALLSIALLSIFMAGCLNYEQTTSLKIDGSGSMFIHYWTKWKTDKDTLLIDNLGIFKKDDVTKEFTSPYCKIKNIDVYKDFQDTTVHAKIEIEFPSFDSLNYMKVFKGSKFELKQGSENLKIFSQFVQPFATGFGIDSKKYHITYIYYIPGDIISHNADELSNNKLTWNFTLDQLGTGKSLEATFRPFRLKETPTWIFVLALSVLTVVFVFLFKKKKK